MNDNREPTLMEMRRDLAALEEAGRLLQDIERLRVQRAELLRRVAETEDVSGD